MFEFETVFSDPGTVRRHREGPLVAERSAYLDRLASRGLSRLTLRGRARACLRVAGEMGRWPPDHCFTSAEATTLASDLDTLYVRCEKAGPRFQLVVPEFLGHLGRLRPDPPPARGEHAAKVDAFVAAQRERGWRSEATCRVGRSRIERFLEYLESGSVALRDLTADDIDGFFAAMAPRWGRPSVAVAAWALRCWLDYAGQVGWVRPGLSAAVQAPPRYRLQGLPLGPAWETVGRMLAATAGDTPQQIRDYAILLMLAVYGLRSGELRRLRLDDIDWRRDRIRLQRSKSGRQDAVPLQPAVGEALARYLTQARPATAGRVVFLTVLPPYRPLSAPGLASLVASRYPADARPERGRGPHGLRHACARRLMASGHSFKAVGDLLGHRSPASTSIYAKVDLRSLRQVAFEDLGDLA